jgi:hypothetical protein
MVRRGRTAERYRIVLHAIPTLAAIMPNLLFVQQHLPQIFLHLLTLTALVSHAKFIGQLASRIYSGCIESQNDAVDHGGSKFRVARATIIRGKEEALEAKHAKHLEVTSSSQHLSSIFV